MNSTPLTVVELTEYQPKSLARGAFPEALGDKLYHEHSNRIEVDYPTPKTDQQWRLTSLGWVGAIPLSPDFVLMLKPKVPLGNLFRMLEYAYSLDFKLLDGLINCDSLAEFYERLANVLAKRVLDRERMGLHRTYVSREELLSCVRGRLDIAGSLRKPWRVELDCQFEEHTADIADNQILAWTMRGILQSGLCSERIRPTIRKAYRGLQGALGLPNPRLSTWRQKNRVDFAGALCDFARDCSKSSA